MTDEIINMDELPFDEQVAILKRFAENFSKPQPAKFDGTIQLINEVNEYLNNWQSATKDGLEKRSRQVRETIIKLKFVLSYSEYKEHIRPEDNDQSRQYIKTLKLLSKNINIRLEKYSGQAQTEKLAGQAQIQQEQPVKPIKKKPDLITYFWTKQPDIQLPKLYSRLIDGGFITASETSSETFTATFTGKSVKDLPEKLRWLKSKALLAYFIDCLIYKKVEDTNWWQVAAYCFDKGSGLVNSRNQFHNSNTGLPKGYQLIDEVLSDLL